MRPSILASAVLASFAAASAAHAQFLVDPSGGTVLSTTLDFFTSYSGRSLGFTASYYGQSFTTVDVSSSGFLSFSGDAWAFNSSFPTGTQRICPMWDSLYVYPGNTITERVQPGVYYSVTWQQSTYDWGHVYQEAQVVWFGANIRMYGFDFQAGDIAFCYKSIGASPWNATVGLEGPANQFTPLPGTTDGFISDATSSLLPNFTNSVKWVLFRPNMSGGYDASIVPATPCTADVDDGSGTGTPDNGVTIDDLLYFLLRFESGC